MCVYNQRGVERGVPVEVLAGTHGHKSIGIRQRGEHSHPGEDYVSFVAQSRAEQICWYSRVGHGGVRRTRWSSRTVLVPP
jgi:hypothetical protein